MKDKIQQAESILQQQTSSKVPKLKDSDFLSWGVTLINLSAYGKTYGGLQKGKIYRAVGRSSSGKTFLCSTVLAEAAANPNFADYDLIYDDVERGALMDVKRFFGSLVNKLTPPAFSKLKEPIFSRSISSFYDRMEKKLDAGRSFIWVIDSLDALVPDKETKMSDGKARINSSRMRKLIEPLEETGSIVLLVSQAKPDMGSIWGGDTTSGGKSPEFYSTLEIWLAKRKTLWTAYKGQKYAIGNTISARIKKNRLSGLDRTVFFPFSPKYGIDDIGANIDFLLRSKHWTRKGSDKEKEETKKAKTLICPEFDFTGKRQDLISKIEKESLERELQVLTGKVWKEIEAATTFERKPRYS